MPLACTPCGLSVLRKSTILGKDLSFINHFHLIVLWAD